MWILWSKQYERAVTHKDLYTDQLRTLAIFVNDGDAAESCGRLARKGHVADVMPFVEFLAKVGVSTTA